MVEAENDGRFGLEMVSRHAEPARILQNTYLQFAGDPNVLDVDHGSGHYFEFDRANTLGCPLRIYGYTGE